MGDDMLGTLFESDATSLLDSEASHLLTELESMTSDPGGTQQPAQQYFDFNAPPGGSMQALQSPSQNIHSPAGSIGMTRSPAGSIASPQQAVSNMMSPSAPQGHFNSPPPPQQQQAMQRQMSQPGQHRYPTYSQQAMQVPHSPQTAMPQSPSAGSSVMWRQPQQHGLGHSTHHHPQQGTQRMQHGYMHSGMPPGGGGGYPGPYQGGASPACSQPQYIPQHQAGMTQEQLMHQQQQHHHQQQQQHQMLYQQQQPHSQQMPPGYMHPGMRSPVSHPQHGQRMPSHMGQSHPMSQQPRMPHPGMQHQQQGYPSHMMHQQRMSIPQQHQAMGSDPRQMTSGPHQMGSPQHGMMPPEQAVIHQQRMQHYHSQQHQQQQYQMQAQHQQHSNEFITSPDGQISYAGVPRPMTVPQQQQHYSHQQHQAMMSPRAQGPTALQPGHPNYNMQPQQQQPHSLQQQAPNSNSLEQLEKMISPIEDGNSQKKLPSLAMPAPNLTSPHAQKYQRSITSPAAVQHSPSISAPSPQNIPHQATTETVSLSQPQIHAQPSKPAESSTNPSFNQNLVALNNEIEALQKHIQQIMMSPHSSEQQQQLLEKQERLQHLKSQQQMLSHHSNPASLSQANNTQVQPPTQQAVNHPDGDKLRTSNLPVGVIGTQPPMTMNSQTQAMSMLQQTTGQYSQAVGQQQSQMQNPQITGSQQIVPQTVSQVAAPNVLHAQQSGTQVLGSQQPATHAQMAPQQIIQHRMVVPANMVRHPTQQLQAIAPRPDPMASQMTPIAPRPSGQMYGYHHHPHLHGFNHPTYNRFPDGPSNGMSMSGHAPGQELQVDRTVLSGISASVGSSSDVASNVNSPALSDAATPGKAKKASKSAKSSSKKTKKAVKKPPASLLKLKKKRKRNNSSDMSDVELSPHDQNIDAQIPEEFIVKRRSGRVTKKQKYVDEPDFDLSDDDKLKEEFGSAGVVMADEAHDTQDVSLEQQNLLVVEKIMGVREGTREVPIPSEEIPSVQDKDEEEVTKEPDEKPLTEPKTETVKVEEFYVKYKNYSYLHCEWRTAVELELTDKRVNLKIKRWKQKRSHVNSYLAGLLDDDELFNPEYVEVERVLCESRVPSLEPGEPDALHYLVKWRQLPYDEATWELEQDVDKSKIEHYKAYLEPPPAVNRIEAPQVHAWSRLPADKMYKENNCLRPYQFEGVNWLTFCYYQRQNCILADEMGLGKTVQSIAYLQAVYDYGIHGPFLIIAPLSTIGNWQREFDSWTDMNVIVYHGSVASRTMLQEYEMFYKTAEGVRRDDVWKFDAIITTYEVILQDVELLAQLEWRCCVIDEAHRLKNKNCKLMEGLRCFNLEHKVLLSGTPLQNNVEELFSLLNFLEPERFKSSAEFLTEFGNLKTEGQVEKLKAILKPMMLRRLKEDVEKNLAPKEETIIEVELTNIQKKYYRAILEKNFTFLSKGGTTTNAPNLMNTMMELRKCCNHPYLIEGAEEQIIMELKDKHKVTAVDSEMLIDAMVQGSGKLVLLDKLLPKLKAGNHKVLIFSQMIRVLDIIEDYLVQRKYIYERIDGRIRGNQRQEAIDRFSKPDSDRFVFLLCTRAGGLGINLTAADTCIIYDSDWNPQNDLQAQARCHRIGQQKAVKVYRLICRNTYEREMFDRASLKLGLDKAVLQSMNNQQNTPNTTAPMGKSEVEELLKKGAYGALMGEDQEGDQFCEEDIDQILQRRTQVITIESVGKGSTFAKASFSSSGARDDIDINDPEFWQKWAKKADIDMNSGKTELIIAEPRRRKQTTRYGGHHSSRIEEISDLESSSDSETGEQSKPALSKANKGRKSKRRGFGGGADDDYEAEDDGPLPGCYSRPECFKVEKMLLIYGWGRWADILQHADFKRELDELDISNMSQAILLYSLQNFTGDKQIKSIIWNLIMPSEDSDSGYVAKGKKAARKMKQLEDGEGDVLDLKIKTCPIDTESILVDTGYRKHLTRHANKVLLRIRMLHYLTQDVVGTETAKVFENKPWTDINIPTPTSDGEPPMIWWDECADKCLLIGVFKHGYEKYHIIRSDSALCFLTRCGPPDGVDLAKEQADDDDDNDQDDDDVNIATPGRGTPAGKSDSGNSGTEKLLPFPSSADLNTRLRRVITSYQRNAKRRQEASERRNTRSEKIQIRVKDLERIEKRARWTRREEADFYRVVSTFGVESNRRGVSDEPRTYRWDTFRAMANLHKKDDAMLTEYLDAFYHMCQRVCHRLTPTEESLPPTMYVDMISEERASRCLARFDLLNKIREEVLWHPQLTERLHMCQFSPEIPMWWKPGEHDKELLIGAAKHGLGRTDQHILYDPKLCFKELMVNSLEREKKPLTPQAVEKTTAKDEPITTPVKEIKEENSPSQTNGEIKPDSENLDESLQEKPDKDEHLESKEVTSLEVKNEDADVSSKADAKPFNVYKTGTPNTEHLNGSYDNTAGEAMMPFYWPKDKVIYQRLELVCFCIEHGEWPTAAVARKLTTYNVTGGSGETPTGTPVPSRTGTPQTEYMCAMDEEEGEGLKLTISKGKLGKKPMRRSRIDLEADRIARLRDGGESESSNPALRDTPDSFMNGSLFGMNLPPGISAEDVLLNQYMRPRKKRGRKSKAEKIAEAKAAAAAAAAASYHKIANLDIDPDCRVSVVNLEDGLRLSGEDAPRRKDLERWLGEHPGYMVDATDTLASSSSSSQGALSLLAGASGSSDKRSRKSRLDPEMLTTTNLTGDENVPVHHRETGKKITGSKAPPLQHLSSWLDKNPQYDVDAKWSSIAKATLPERLHNRVLSDKRKRKTAADLSASSSSSLAAQQAAALSQSQALLAASMQGYPMNLAAFNSMAALGIPPSLLSMYGLAMPGADGADGSTTEEETAKALAAAAAAAATSSAHSAFPYQMYNPMLTYSSMMMQGMGLSQSYAQALASAGLFNGMMGYDPSSAGTELDSDMAEKLAAMTATMNGMNAMEDLQLRSKMIDELYGRGLSGRGGSSKEGTSTPPPKKRKPQATVVERSSDIVEGSSASDSADLPEDLSMKPRTDSQTSKHDDFPIERQNSPNQEDNFSPSNPNNPSDMSHTEEVECDDTRETIAPVDSSEPIITEEASLDCEQSVEDEAISDAS